MGTCVEDGAMGARGWAPNMHNPTRAAPQHAPRQIRSGPLSYYCAGFCLSAVATASNFYRFTESIFNPSISLVLAITGVIKLVRFLRTCTTSLYLTSDLPSPTRPSTIARPCRCHPGSRNPGTRGRHPHSASARTDRSRLCRPVANRT